jgi:hypothetical protein
MVGGGHSLILTLVAFIFMERGKQGRTSVMIGGSGPDLNPGPTE